MVTESPLPDADKQNAKEYTNDANNALKLEPNNSSILPTKPLSLPFDPNVKHPLRHGWVLWYDGVSPSGKGKSSQWGDNIREIYSFSTVEDFWRLMNNIAKPSQLQSGCTYNLFKKGITPKWEDDANKLGGKWTIIVGKTKNTLDRLWLWMVLACIGEVLEEDVEQQICGAVVNVRKAQDKLCLWTRDAENKEATMRVGFALKRALELPENVGLGYQGHFQKNTRQNKFEI